MKAYGPYPVSTSEMVKELDKACKFLKVEHYLHSPYLRKASLLKGQCNT